MTGTADPWEPPCAPAFLWKTQRTPTVERTGGPERIYDAAAAKQPPPPRGPLGFAPPLYDVEREPLLWEGDDA